MYIPNHPYQTISLPTAVDLQGNLDSRYPFADLSDLQVPNSNAGSSAAKMKARGKILLVLLCGCSGQILVTSHEDSTRVDSLMSSSDSPLSSSRPGKTNCKAKKMASPDGEMPGLSMSTVAFGTTTVTDNVSQPSGADKSYGTATTSRVTLQADPSHLMFNGTSPVAVIENATEVGFVHSPGGANNKTFAMPSSALYPIHTYEVPYRISGRNTSYMNATLTTGHGLAFLISTWSSEGTMYTSNLGVLLPEPTSSIIGISPNSTSPSSSSTTGATLGGQEQDSTTTIFVNATRTLNVKLTMTSTTTSAFTSVESDTQTSLLSSRPARLGARYAKHLFRPKPFADLRSYWQRVKPQKAHNLAENDEKEDNPSKVLVTNAGSARLAPAVPALAVVALAVMLVYGVSLDTTSSSTVASKSSSDGPTVFTGGPAPIHILNSIITPSPPSPSARLKVSAAESTATSGPRRAAFGVAASPIPGKLSEPPSTTIGAALVFATYVDSASDYWDADRPAPPSKREPKGFKPKPNACAAGTCSSAKRAVRAANSSLFAFAVEMLVLMLLLPAANASGVQSLSTTISTPTYTLSPPAAASGFTRDRLRTNRGVLERQRTDESARTSTAFTLNPTSSVHLLTQSEPELEQGGACGASFPHPCSSDAASRSVLISTATLLAAALTMLGVFYAVSG